MLRIRWSSTHLHVHSASLVFCVFTHAAVDSVKKSFQKPHVHFLLDVRSASFCSLGILLIRHVLFLFSFQNAVSSTKPEDLTKVAAAKMRVTVTVISRAEERSPHLRTAVRTVERRAAKDPQTAR